MNRRRVRFTATARDHVRYFRRWWQENSVRPQILHEDLSAAIRLVAALPGVGTPYLDAPVAGVRRLYLERLTAHLYFTFDDELVVIRALWHSRRGSGPALSEP